jgi:hypothetical protein
VFFHLRDRKHSCQIALDYLYIHFHGCCGWDLSQTHQTYCERSSIRVCRLLLRTQDKLRSEHRLHGGPLSFMMHFICFWCKPYVFHNVRPCRTFCLRHDAQALTFRDTTGIDGSASVSETRGREAGGAEVVPLFTSDQDRFGGMTFDSLAQARCRL